MSVLLWKRLLREDPRAYRARVEYFSTHGREAALSEYMRSLDEAEFLQHLEALFPPDELGASDYFALGMSWTGTGTFNYSLGAHGAYTSRLWPGVRDVGDRHWPAVLPWVRDATFQREMAPWRGTVSPGEAPALELPSICLAQLPDAHIASIDLKFQPGDSDASGYHSPTQIHVLAQLGFPDGGTLRMQLGHWPREEFPRLEEWARQQMSREVT